MLPARKEEVFPVDGDSKKVEERLGAFEVGMAVLTNQCSRLMTDMSELKSDMKELRTRMEDGFQSIRKEMHDGFESIHKEMHDGFQSIHKDLSSAKIWALLIAAAMLGVMARGFHWI